MADLEGKLKSALAQDDDAFLAELDQEQGPLAHLHATLRGPMAAMTYAALVFMLAFLGLMAWTAWEAFHAETERATTLWSAGFVASLIPFGLVRLWLWNHANHLAVLRELKKLELRVVRLSEKGR